MRKGGQWGFPTRAHLAQLLLVLRHLFQYVGQVFDVGLGQEGCEARPRLPRSRSRMEAPPPLCGEPALLPGSASGPPPTLSVDSLLLSQNVFRSSGTLLAVRAGRGEVGEVVWRQNGEGS